MCQAGADHASPSGASSTGLSLHTGSSHTRQADQDEHRTTEKHKNTKYQMGKINGTENTKDKNEIIKQKKTFKKLTTSEQQVPDS